MRNAFTLIEALVAAALATMVLGILTATLYQVRSTTAARERMTQDRDATEFLHELLDGDMAHALPPSAFPGIEDPDEAGQSLIRYQADYLSFLTTHNIAAAAHGAQQGPALVTYRVRESGRSKSIMRTEYRISTDAARAAVFEMLAYRGELPMGFRYLTRGGQWVNGIPREQYRNEAPPAAVAFAIVYQSDEVVPTERLYTCPAWPPSPPAAATSRE